MEHSIINYILHNDYTHKAVKYSEEYKKVSDKRFKVYEKLRNMLTDEQREQFDLFEELETEERCLKSESYFKLGVKVGVRLVSECMFD